VLTMGDREDEMPEMLLPRPWSSGTSDVSGTHSPLNSNTAQNNGSVYDEVIANNMPVSLSLAVRAGVKIHDEPVLAR